MKKIRKALYSGSFDPITYGHIDLVRRALKIFDEIHVGIAMNTEKKPLFSVEERLELLKKTIGRQKGVKVAAFNGLSVRYARKNGLTNIIRGVRATSDFDYEFQMALTNRQLAGDIDTLFLMPSEKNFYLSSRLIKEVVRLGGDVSQFVPKIVAKALRQK